MSEIKRLKVKSTSNPSSVAGAIAKNIEEGHTVEITAIGAGAVNQTVKATAIARGFVAPAGKDLVLVPGFEDTKIDGEDRTSMLFKIRVN